MGWHKWKWSECPSAKQREGQHCASLLNRNGLLSDVILSLASAANGDLWVGTPDGLNRIRGGSITAFTSADGLPDDFIRSLFADEDGSLWIGTRRGLTHWLTDTGRSGAEARACTWRHLLRPTGWEAILLAPWFATLRGDVGCYICRPVAVARGQDRQLHDHERTLKQRCDGAVALRQWHASDRHAGSRVGRLGWAPFFRRWLTVGSVRHPCDSGRSWRHLWFATENGIARCHVSSEGLERSEVH